VPNSPEIYYEIWPEEAIYCPPASYLSFFTASFVSIPGLEQGHLGEDTQLSILKFHLQLYKCTVDCAMYIITLTETVYFVETAQLY
jgi:hypothetical protein